MHAVGELHTPPNFCPPGLKEAQAGLDSHDHFLSCKGSLRGMLTAVWEWWRVLAVAASAAVAAAATSRSVGFP